MNDSVVAGLERCQAEARLSLANSRDGRRFARLALPQFGG